jgi:hypothetical protein
VKLREVLELDNNVLSSIVGFWALRIEEIMEWAIMKLDTAAANELVRINFYLSVPFFHFMTLSLPNALLQTIFLLC